MGNRGVWEEANNLGAMNYISQARLNSFGLNLNNAADRDLLTQYAAETTRQKLILGMRCNAAVASLS